MPPDISQNTTIDNCSVNHACSTSLPIAWELLHEIRDLLSSKELFATTGNHDVDSRRIHNEYDPIEALKQLDPPFPIGDRNLRNQFWSEHFFIFEDPVFRLLVVNSSAYHTNETEVEHGRVADITLNQIRDELAATSSPKLNVLLCHHNPHKHSELDLGEHDEIRGGQLLLDLIGGPSHFDWLVIHGHKHHPKVSYAAGPSSSPVVFSAGSIASTLYPELRGDTGNQFYIVEVDTDDFPHRGLVGTFNSWDWHPGGFGWQKADSRRGLPAVGGFGNRENPYLLANRMKSFLLTVTTQHLRSSDIYERFPELKYVAPTDLENLMIALESIGVACEFSDERRMEEVCVI